MPYVVIQDRSGDPTGIWVLLTSGAWWALDAIQAGTPPPTPVQICATWADASQESRLYGGPKAGNRILSARSAGVLPKPV